MARTSRPPAGTRVRVGTARTGILRRPTIHLPHSYTEQGRGMSLQQLAMLFQHIRSSYNAGMTREEITKLTHLVTCAG